MSGNTQIMQCSLCGNIGVQLSRRFTCKRVWYCDQTCQKLHHCQHTDFCKKQALELMVEGSLSNPTSMECTLCGYVLPFQHSLYYVHTTCCGCHICVPCSSTYHKKCMFCRCKAPVFDEAIGLLTKRANYCHPNSMAELGQRM